MALETETLVIGASVAGLATAAQLRRRGLELEIVEAADQVGATWRTRYDRLHLHTPRSVSRLPGLSLPRGWPRYLSRDQVVEYLERYATRFELWPRFGERVVGVERLARGWETTTTQGTWRSRNVVVATGLARVPVRPAWPGLERFGGVVLHSSEYRNGEPWRGRSVLVVGFGNSACEQALDLVEHGAAPHLAVRSPVNAVPRDVFGAVPVLWVARLLRPLPPPVADALAWPVVRLSRGDLRHLGLTPLPYGALTQITRDRRVPLLDIGTLAEIRSGHITLHPGIDHVTERGVVFTDGTELAVDAIVLATGYRAGFEEFLPAWREACDEDGFPLHSGAPSGLPGLYFCGMYILPSGMFPQIGLEAAHIARSINASRPRSGAVTTWE
jgi:indole-3-pyruvate monooxygenase